MSESRRERLIDLGAEALADALLKLADQNDAVKDMVERMVATREKNVERFKRKLAAIKKSRRFIPWRESADFALELEGLLEDLKAGVKDPRVDCEMVALFYEADRWVFESCDDSSGYVGDVYHYEAKDLFVDYARRCTEKERLADLVFELNQNDDYGVRDVLIDCATDYLPKSNILAMIARLQETADRQNEEYGRRDNLRLIEALARQIGDPKLFETARLASGETPSTAACVDIAKVNLESGDPHSALAWLEGIAADGSFMTHERDRLLLEIYGQLGDTQKQTDVAWRIFRGYRSKDSLQNLLSVIGNEHRETVIANEAALILEEQDLSLSNATFFVELGLMDEAENYLLERADQLNGGFYASLLPLAVAMEDAERPVTATLIYRALLDSILQRAKSKTYHHGVRYLKKLDGLARSVTDWLGMEGHRTYCQRLRQVHGRKYSFWSQYGK